MKTVNFFFIILLMATSIESNSQIYFEKEDPPIKIKHFSLTPIGAFPLDTDNFLFAGKLKYLISDNISTGIQFVLPTEETYYYSKSQKIIYAIVEGNYFIPKSRFGFHATAGIGYAFKNEDIAGYFDIGPDIKLTNSIIFQVQFMQVHDLSAVGLGVQFRF